MPRPRGRVTQLLLAGGALALLVPALDGTPFTGSAPDDASHVIVLDATRLREAERAYVATTGRPPDAAERAALADAEIDDEILYREALARGLDDGDTVVQHRIAGNLAFVEDGPPPGVEPDGLASRGRQPHDRLSEEMLREDVVIRRRLVERMRARLEHGALASEPTDAQLEQALAANAARFALPARVRIAVADERARNASGAPDTRTAVEAPTAPDPADVRELPAQSQRDLARTYGATFAETAFRTAPGAWSAPIATPSGRVRVLVREHEPPRTPPFADVRNQVRDFVRRERADAGVRRALDELRRGYAVSSAGDSADRPG